MRQPLPLQDDWPDADSYIAALLSFATSTPLFLNLCGGVHILDFLTSTPDLYTTLLPAEWRSFFAAHALYDILDLILTDDLAPFARPDAETTWNNGPLPPASLLEYIHNIRRLSLKRDFTPATPRGSAIPRRVAVGMKAKKLHEVEHFSQYVDGFSTAVSETRGEPVTHIVDFGSGQNYLGRTLAHSYDRHVIAIERKHAFIQGAKGMDVHAQMEKKKQFNREEYDARQKEQKESAHKGNELEQIHEPEQVCETCPPEDEPQEEKEDSIVFTAFQGLDIDASDLPTMAPNVYQKAKEQVSPRGAISYIEHNINDGYLEPIIRHVVEPTKPKPKPTSKEDATPRKSSVMVISLHSCGNLLHHGIRSLILNPSVAAIAMVGCCYNLLTERLGPATYKLPVLRHMHQRLVTTSTANDPHGFPMSNLFEQYQHSAGSGIKFNITARMMACQAPFNWSREETEAFFTRHYYRALLQRFFVDHGVIPEPKLATFDALKDAATASEDEKEKEKSPPVVIGSLKKTAYTSFVTYAQAAMTKLCREPAHRGKLSALMQSTPSAELEAYVTEYAHAKKNISIVWLLMAFSATLVEAMIVVDRWQFLREHVALGLVKECWVEPVFEYKESPRNLAVIGIKP
jgi:Methyltransferase domain